MDCPWPHAPAAGELGRILSIQIRFHVFTLGDIQQTRLWLNR